jgi:hypothetical protein
VSTVSSAAAWCNRLFVCARVLCARSLVEVHERVMHNMHDQVVHNMHERVGHSMRVGNSMRMATACVWCTARACGAQRVRARKSVPFQTLFF